MTGYAFYSEKFLLKWTNQPQKKRRIMKTSADEGIHLVASDRIEILTVIDNTVDLLLKGSETVLRPPLDRDGRIPTDTFLAEHGLSIYIRVSGRGESKTVLLDAGYADIGVPHNLRLLGVDLEAIDSVVLSHGHMDHYGALLSVLDNIKKPMPLVVHPEAFSSPRYVELPDKGLLVFPALKEKDLLARGVRLIPSKIPYVSSEGLWAVTGEVERTTGFETGLPDAWIERDGKMEKDETLDDQSVVMAVKDRGLVIVAGCAHAGIVNTIRYSQKITGIDRVYAILGGFHLSGKHFEAIIDRTIEELRAIGPDVIVPMHCTGWKAIERMSRAFPEQFVLNSVGTRILL